MTNTLATPASVAPSARRQYLKLADESLGDANHPAHEQVTRDLCALNAQRAQAAALIAIGFGLDELIDRMGQLIAAVDDQSQQLADATLPAIGEDGACPCVECRNRRGGA